MAGGAQLATTMRSVGKHGRIAFNRDFLDSGPLGVFIDNRHPSFEAGTANITLIFVFGNSGEER
jgi:hypothetical protein